MKKTIGYAAFAAAMVISCVEPDESASVEAVFIYATVFLSLLLTAVLCIAKSKKK